MEKIVITGYAIITPLGNKGSEVWSKLCQFEDAVEDYDDLKAEGFRFTRACRVTSFENEIPGRRGFSMMMQCIREAITDSAIDLPRETGVFVGSTIGESSAFEAKGKGETNINLQHHTVGAWCNDAKEQLQLTGPVMAFGTACAAGNYAVGTAASYMRKHHLDVAIAGGAEPFSRIAMTGFSRSRAMTTDYCKPFDKSRNGMILGEGAAFFILETESHAMKRGAQPLAVVGALGLSSDAWHPTAPLPDGSGMMAAMQQALKNENLSKDQVGWVCAHGSGTIASDVAEAKAICGVFGDHGVDVSAYKGALGHSLGAATAIQIALCVESIRHNAIAPAVNCTDPDAGFRLNMVSAPKQKKVNHMLNCGYAFGGINSALIISAC